MKNWTISRRVLGAGLVLVLSLVVVSALGYLTSIKIERYVHNRLENDAIPGMVNIADITSEALMLNVETLVAAQNDDIDEREAILVRADQALTRLKAAKERYAQAITAEEDRQNLTKLEGLLVVYLKERTDFLNALNLGQMMEATARLKGKVGPAFDAYRAQARLMLDWNSQVAYAASKEVIDLSAESGRSTLVISGAAILLGVALGVWILRNVNRALNEMAETLSDASSQVAAASRQVSSASQSLAEGSSVQASSLEETSSSLEELSSMTKRNAESAQTAKNLASESRSATEKGNQDVDAMRQAMGAIQSSSNDIAKIIKTIDEIAFQTNLLALNAAVEAARAGEAGAGFAVVAEEVRALAKRSAESAKETAEKISVAIQNGERGAQVSNQVATTLATIAERVHKVDDLVGEIARASQEQSEGINQINSAVTQMDSVTQSNAGNAEETAAAAEELSAQAMTLQDTVIGLRKLVGAKRSKGHDSTPKPGESTEPRHEKSAQPANDLTAA